MKTELVVRPGIIVIKFDESLFFSTILGFNPHKDYKLSNEYISRTIINLGTTKKLI